MPHTCGGFRVRSAKCVIGLVDEPGPARLARWIASPDLVSDVPAFADEQFSSTNRRDVALTTAKQINRAACRSASGTHVDQRDAHSESPR
jgi:hypothetical protein